MEIRPADAEDWPKIYPFYSTIVEAGETYAFPPGQSSEPARPWWMEPPPGQTVVAEDGAEVLGSARSAPIVLDEEPTLQRHRSWSTLPTKDAASGEH